MSDRLDRVLDVLDAGLQTSAERGYAHDQPDRCARCQRHDPMPDGDLCEGCRAFLLDDTDEDPSRSFRFRSVPGAVAVSPQVAVDTGPLLEAFNRAAANFEQTMSRVAEVFETSSEGLADLRRAALPGPDTADEDLDLRRLRHGHAAVCPHHGPTRGGTCLACVRPRSRRENR